jgi:glycosyltransferase involved in cell wall biosynthesis
VRVLYFSRDYTPHDHRFLAALAQSDHSIYYLRLEKREPRSEELPLPQNIETVPWVGGKQPVNLIELPGLFLGLRKVLSGVVPDLIHAGPLQSCAWLAAITGFHPLVSMSWGYDLMQDAEKNAYLGWMTRFTLRRSTIMIGDCEAVRNQAIRFGMERDRIVIFPWGVDLSNFAPRNISQRNTDRFTLLSVRAWEPVYGVDTIARAFIKVARQHPDVYLIMLGAGSQGELIRKIITDGGVVDRVSFPGRVSQASLPDYYRAADLVLERFPYRWFIRLASGGDGVRVSVRFPDIPGNRKWIQTDITGGFSKKGL